MSTGKFHGLTAATTPTGSWTIRIRFAFVRSCVEGSTWPACRSTSSEARRKWSTVNSSISSRDSRIVLPTSREIICAISSLRSMQSTKARRQISTRSTTDVLRHVTNASPAARTAASTCDGVEETTDPRSSPVAGLRTSISSPSPATHSPPMNAPFRVVTAIVLSSFAGSPGAYRPVENGGAEFGHDTSRSRRPTVTGAPRPVAS